MILLVTNADLLQVVTSGSQAIKVHASYIDVIAGAITPGRLNTAISSATTTNVVTSPAGGVSRNVKFLSIQNTDGSIADTITVQHTDGTTVSVLFKVSLLAGYTLTYFDGSGWQIYDATGARLQSTLSNTSASSSGLTIWQNSLISGDFASPQWQPWQLTGSVPPSVQPYSGTDLAGGQTAAIINAGLNAANDLIFGFCLPGTGFSVAVDAATIAGSGLFNWVLWDETQTQVSLSSAVSVTTSTPTLSTYTNTFTGLTSGRFYFVGFRFNTGAQGSFLMSNPRVNALTGVSATSMFAGSFQRIDIKPDLLFGNHLLEYAALNNLRMFAPHAPHAEARLATNASKIGVELYNPYKNAGGGAGNLGIRVNGNPNVALALGGTPFSYLIEQALPGGTQQVDVIAGDNSIGATTPTFLQMPYISAIYVPAGASVGRAPRPLGFKVLEYGDSKTAGVGSVPGCFESYVALMKSNTTGEFYVDAGAGRALANDASSAALVAATAARLAAINPTHINFEIGYNDWANAQTAANFGTWASNLSTSLIALLPNVTIRWILPIISGAEATTNGTTLLTLGQFRQSLRASIKTLNKANVVVRDGCQMVPIGQLYVDGIHPNAAGHASLWQSLASDMGFTQGNAPFDVTQVNSVVASWKPEYGFSAGSWLDEISALNLQQATGSKQPTMSSTGGPNGWPCVQFTSASSQFLTLSSCPITNNNFTIFVMAKSLATNTQMEWVDLGDTDTGEGFGIGTDLNATGNRNGEHGGVAGEMSWGSATTNWEVWSVQRNAGTVSARVNGSAQTVSGATQTINAFNAQITVGARNNGASEFLNGSIRRIILCNAVLTLGQIQGVEAALRAESALW